MQDTIPFPMKISVNTVQNVGIDYELAGVGSRILATLLDFLILGSLSLLFALIGGLGVSISQGSTGSVVFFIILLSLLPLYHLLCELFFHGKSIGKMAFRLQVVRLDGKKVSFWDYMLRWVFRLIDITLTSGVTALLSIVLTKHTQRIGDLAAGTTVIRQKNPVSLQDLTRHATPAEYTVVFPQVSLLSDRDIRIINEVIAEVNRSLDFKLLDPLAKKIKEVTGISSPMDNQTFIKTILKDYYHLAQE